MIIDGYYNTWERETRSGYLAGDEFGAEQMHQAIDVAGVDIAVSCPLGQAIANTYIRSVQQPRPDRGIGFGQVTASRRLGPEKIIIGTDWPGTVFDLERMKIARAIPDPEHRQRVEGGNLAALPSLEPGRMTTTDRRNLA